VLALAGYLLFAPPVFVLGPLAGLLLVSRPGTVREWIWLLGGAAWSLLWLQQLGGLGGQVARASGVLMSGTFLALTLWRPSNRPGRAVAATVAAGAALVVWMRRLGIGWTDLVTGVDRDLAAYQTALGQQWRNAGASPEMVERAAAAMHSAAELFPALLALASIAGLRLAWAWYHRLAAHPLGAPPAPFRSFRFNDQLVWGLVAGLGLSLAPLPEAWQLLGANLLLALGALYAVRGLAVFLAQSGRVTGPMIIVLALITFFLLPFVVGGLTLLGLADTWLNFRRRHPTPTTGGSNG
jgi:hypothetical protein